MGWPAVDSHRGSFPQLFYCGLFIFSYRPPATITTTTTLHAVKKSPSRKQRKAAKLLKFQRSRVPWDTLDTS